MNEELISALKKVLADTYAVYFKAQGYHWNVEGVHFQSFHELFGNIYEDVYGSVDSVAENIRKLQAYAPYKMSRMIELTSIPETEVGSDCHSMAADLLAAVEMNIASVNAAFAVADATNEQGIADFLASRDDMLKKWAWQLRVSIK